jgi:hypothetical protein
LLGGRGSDSGTAPPYLNNRSGGCGFWEAAHIGAVRSTIQQRMLDMKPRSFYPKKKRGSRRIPSLSGNTAQKKNAVQRL